jgi:hypothetical protein
MHHPGGPHGGQQPSVAAPQPQVGGGNEKQGEGSKLTKNGVINAIGKVHENV